MSSGEELSKRLRLIKKIAGHEARLDAIKLEIAAQFGTNPPRHEIAWRLRKIGTDPAPIEREASYSVDRLLSDIEKLLLLPNAIRGAGTLAASREGGNSQSKWPQKAEEMQKAVNALYVKHSDYSYEAIKRLANTKHGYPLSALKRYTTNPNKK